MSNLRVGVLRGGPSSEYEVSLKTGASVLSSLPKNIYEPRDIFISRDGTWHLGGLPVWPEQVAEQVDIFFNCLHGEYGEDGQIQRLLHSLDKPYTGPEEIPALTSINKPMTKQLLARAGLKVAPSMIVIARANHRESAEQIFKKIPPPWVVKPADRGSSVGLSFARSFDQLIDSIGKASAVSDQILVEQLIKGKEGTVGVVERFRGQPLYTLFPVEKCSHGHLCPGTFTDEEKADLAAQAILAHEHLGLRHYSNSDFIVSPRGIYLLEVNSLPGMTPDSLLPRALEAVGVRYPDFLTHVIDLALERDR